MRQHQSKPANSTEFPEFRIAGVRIHAIRLADAVSTIGDWITAGHKDYIVLTGAHGVVEMQRDPVLREINNSAGLVTPDGMPVVWLGRLHGFDRIEKVYAPDIMNETFCFGLPRGLRHFFYGGGPGVTEELVDRLCRKFAGLRVAGAYTPPFRPLVEQEIAKIADHINSTDADIVWVGLGCPKQEHWMHLFRPLLRAPVLIGVGAGFDFLSGRKPLAPRWVQQSGFEWFYRMLSEPRRLWPRYSRVVPHFLYLAVRDQFHQLR